MASASASRRSTEPPSAFVACSPPPPPKSAAAAVRAVGGALAYSFFTSFPPEKGCLRSRAHRILLPPPHSAHPSSLSPELATSSRPPAPIDEHAESSAPAPSPAPGLGAAPEAGSEVLGEGESLHPVQVGHHAGTSAAAFLRREGGGRNRALSRAGGRSFFFLSFPPCPWFDASRHLLASLLFTPLLNPRGRRRRADNSYAICSAIEGRIRRVEKLPDADAAAA